MGESEHSADAVPAAVGLAIDAGIDGLDAIARAGLAKDTIRDRARETYLADPDALAAALAQLRQARADRELYDQPSRATSPIETTIGLAVLPWGLCIIALIVLYVAKAFGALSSMAVAPWVGAFIALTSVIVVMSAAFASVNDRARRRHGVEGAPRALAMAQHELEHQVRAHLVQPALRELSVVELDEGSSGAGSVVEDVEDVTSASMAYGDVGRAGAHSRADLAEEELDEERVDPAADLDAAPLVEGRPAPSRASVQLSSRTTPDQRINTISHEQVLAHIGRQGGATVGIAGERGAGKSELLRAFCEAGSMSGLLELAQTVGVIIPAPVAYRSEEFLRLLALRLCEATPGFDDRWSSVHLRVWGRGRAVLAVVGGALLAGGFSLTFPEARAAATRNLLGPGLLGLGAALLAVVLVASARDRWGSRLRRVPIPGEAKTVIGAVLSWFSSSLRPRPMATMAAVDLARRLRFVETQKLVGGGEAAWGPFKATSSLERGLSALPLTEPEIVAEIARLARHLSDAGFQVIVGIDELDKLESDEKAMEFLNGIKALFPIRECSFLISISESAWISFTGRGVPIRDVFDSSLDSVVVVEPLDLFEARALLGRRSDRFSDREVILCYWLAGGLPRELLRYARSLLEVSADADDVGRFGEVALALVHREVQDQCRRVELEARALIPAARHPVISWAGRIGAAATPDGELGSTLDGLRLVVDQSVGNEVTRDLLEQLHVSCAFLALVADLVADEAFPDRWAGRSVSAVGSELALVARARRRIEVDLMAGWDAVQEARTLLLPGGSLAVRRQAG